MENSNTFAVRKAIGKIVRLYCNSPKNNFVAKVVSFLEMIHTFIGHSPSCEIYGLLLLVRCCQNKTLRLSVENMDQKHTISNCSVAEECYYLELLLACLIVMHNHHSRTGKKVSYAVGELAQLYERCFFLQIRQVVLRKTMWSRWGKRIDHPMKELQCTNNYPSIDEYYTYEKYLLNLGCGMKTQ